MSKDISMESADIGSDVRRGRNRLAVTVILGHAVKHVFNSSLPLLLAMLKVDPKFALSATEYGVIAGVGRGTSEQRRWLLGIWEKDLPTEQVSCSLYL